MNIEDQTPSSETTEDLYEEKIANDNLQEDIESSGTEEQITRGTNFRKALLKRIPPFQYPDELNQEDFNLKTVLSPLFNLKAKDFIEQLRKIIPEER